MSSPSEHRKRKKREKKRLKDRSRQQSARAVRRSSKVKNVRQLASRPVGECFASESWQEHGPTSVWVAVSRVHDNGKRAASVFHLDLRERGIIKGELFPELVDGQLESLLGQRAGEQPVLACEPALAAALIHAAQQLPSAQDRQLAPKVVDALGLLGDIDPEDCPYEILVGPPPEPEPEEERANSVGLVDRVKGWFRR